MNSKGKKRPNKSPRQTDHAGPGGSGLANQQDVGSSGEQTGENPMEQFERELYWCVQQLRLGLETQNPDSRQARDATKVLKILLNPKAVMVKKRQVMRATFGDYRKKIQEEEKRSAAAAKRVKLSAVGEAGHQKSQFYKKSVTQSIARQPDVAVNQSIDLKVGAEDGGANDLNNSFRFNFSISDNGASGTGGCAEAANQADNSSSTNSDSTETKSFLFKKSENSFKFNFEITPEG